MILTNYLDKLIYKPARVHTLLLTAFQSQLALNFAMTQVIFPFIHGSRTTETFHDHKVNERVKGNSGQAHITKLGSFLTTCALHFFSVSQKNKKTASLKCPPQGYFKPETRERKILFINRNSSVILICGR